MSTTLGVEVEVIRSFGVYRRGQRLTLNRSLADLRCNQNLVKRVSDIAELPTQEPRNAEQSNGPRPRGRPRK